MSENKNALSDANQIDRDLSGTPDFIERIAKRLQFSYKVYNAIFVPNTAFNNNKATLFINSNADYK